MHASPCQSFHPHAGVPTCLRPSAVPLQHDDFAVDTHVHEISKALAWVPVNCTRDQAYAHLNDRVPGELKFDLHVLLVNHGKQCPACAKAGSARAKAADPSACPLADLKPPRCQLQKAAAAGAKRRGGAGGKRGKGAAAAVKDEEGAVKEEADVEVASAAAGGEAVAVKEEEIEEVAAAGGDAVPGKRRRSSKASASSS